MYHHQIKIINEIIFRRTFVKFHYVLIESLMQTVNIKIKVSNLQPQHNKKLLKIKLLKKFNKTFMQ